MIQQLGASRTRPFEPGSRDVAVDHLPWMDTVRVLAALAVVWIHTPQSPELQRSVALGRFAVPFFVGASVLLILRRVRRDPRRPWSEFAIQRLRRIGLPFVAWSLLYLALKLVKKWAAPQQPNDFPGWEATLLGTAYHLWFLPFLLVVSLAVFGVGQVVYRRSWTAPAIGLSLLLGLGIAQVAPPAVGPAWEPLTFMWLALPGAAWSLAFALAWLEFPAIERDAGVRRTIASAVLLVTTALLWWLGRDATVEGLAGLACLALAVDLQPAARVPWINRLAPFAYGIYLAHLMVLKVAESLLQRLDWPASPTQDGLRYAVAICGALAIAWGLHLSRHTRWLLG